MADLKLVNPDPSTDPKKPEPSKLVMPRCPYCKARPCNLGMNLVGFGPVPVAVFICSKCEKVLSCSIVPPEPLRSEEPPKTRLIIPN